MAVLVGKPAPDFSCAAILPDGTLEPTFRLADAVRGRCGLLFFYPLDFSVVCPSELIALDRRMDAFLARNVAVVAVSIDSHFSHLAWRNTPVAQGGIGPVRFTLAADLTQQICRDYDVQTASGMAYRGAFIIDPQGVVRSQLVNDLPLGRNIDELLRTIDALQFHAEHGEVCPAGWQQGEPGMQADPAGAARYLADHSDKL